MAAAEEWGREDAFEALDELDERVLLRNAFDLWVYKHLCPEDMGGKWVCTPEESHRVGMQIVHQELLWDIWERAAWGYRWKTDECQHLVRFHACLEELTVVGKPCVFPTEIPTAGWVGEYV